MAPCGSGTARSERFQELRQQEVLPWGPGRADVSDSFLTGNR